MAKYRVVHYINQFFASIGGEEMAHIPPEVRPGPVGPGLSFQANLGEDFEIVATVVCGDNYFGGNMDTARAELLPMIEAHRPDVFVAGPAFNAGRYGVACGTICKTVEEALGIPVITGMYHENPGVDMYRKDLIIVETSGSAGGMRTAVPTMANIVKKLAAGQPVGGPAEEGYIERGIRVNYFNSRRGSERAVEMLLQKMAKQPYTTEYPMPKFDRVQPCAAIKDIGKVKVALVTSGGIVPTGNPDRIESSSASKYGVYDITGMDSMSPDDFMTIHGGYDRAYVLENPNLVVPLDVMRQLEKEQKIGELTNYFVTTTGTGTSVGNAKRFGEDFSKKLLEDNVGAVILTST